MKNLLLLFISPALFAACSSSSLSPPQQAVSDYLKKSLDDPASYAPVRWGAARPWRQRQADSVLAQALYRQWKPNADHAQSFMDSTSALYRLFGEDTLAQRQAMRSAQAAAERADKLLPDMQRLAKSKALAVVGVCFTHAFRAKNKMGALVLDSARFIVSKSGEVTTFKTPD